MSGSWADNARQYKLKRTQDPVERRKRAQRIPTRKTLLDRLESARKSLLWNIERREEHGRDSWWAAGYDWSLKRYEKALKDCNDAGIPVQM